MLYRQISTIKKLLSVSLILSSSSILAQSPTVDAKEASESMNFCIYESQPYSIGSIIEVAGITRECKESIKIPQEKPTWVDV